MFALLSWALMTGTALAAKAGTGTFPQPRFIQEDECDITELPYSESFENSGTSLPPCWNHLQSGQSTATLVNNEYHSGANSLKISGKSGEDAIVVSPKLTGIDLGFTKISFYVKKGTNDLKLEIGCMSDPTDASDFDPIYTIENITTSWVKHTVYLNGQEGEYIAFRIKDQNNWSPSDIYIDDLYWELAEDCPNPRNLSVSNVTSFSALVKWEASPTSNPHGYELEYQQEGAEEWNYVTVEGTNSQTIPGLIATTTYLARLRANCNESGTSEWDTVSFRTLCTEYIPNDIIGDVQPNNYLNLFPFALSSNCSYTQQIYDKSSLQDIDDGINALSFLYKEGAPDVERDIVLYLGHSDANAFAGNSWIPYSNLEEVFRGKVLFAAGQDQWPTIYFDKTFTYNTEKHLVIAVLDNTGNSASFAANHRFVLDTVAHNSSLFISGSAPYDPENLTVTGYPRKVRNNIRLLTCGNIECIAPHVEIPSQNGNITDETADVTLIPSNYGSAWEVEYKVDTATNWTSFGIVTETDFTIEGLAASANYMLRARTVCGEEDTSAWSQVSTFITSCGMIRNDTFYEDFNASAELPECWNLIHNISGPLTPKVAPGEGISGSNGLKFYSSSSQYCYIVLPELDEYNMSQEFVLEFQLKAGQGKIVVGNMLDPTDIATFEGVDTIEVTIANLWTLHQIVSSIPANGSTFLAFQWLGGQAYMDNVAVKPIFCMTPANIKTTERSANSATLAWTQPHTAEAWNIKYGEYGFDPENEEEFTLIEGVSNPYTLTPLTEGTIYQVYIQAQCGVDDHSEWSAPFTFTTFCQSVSTPYTENFDDNTTMNQNFPTCWSRPVTYAAGTLVYPLIDTRVSSSAPQSLKFASTPGSPIFAVTPQIQNIMSEHEIIFYLRKDHPSAGSMDIGVMTSPDDTNSFQLVETIVPENTNWKRYTVSFEEVEGNDLFIAFKHHGEMNNRYFYLDNVTVAPIGTIEPATYDITITSNAGGTVLPGDTTVEEGTYLPITFTPDQGYRVERIELDGNTIQRDGFQHTLENIQANHTFNVIFAELCAPPADIQFTEITDSSVLVTWGANIAANQWQIEFRNITETEWQIIDCEENCGLSRDTLSGLMAGTTYELHVRFHCVEGWSSWSQTGTFTTNLSSCGVPSDITVETFADSAFISWTLIEDIDGWQLEYKAEGDESWTVVDCTDDCDLTEKGLPELESNTNYTLRIRNKCGENFGNWSEEKTFTTDEEIGIRKYDWENNITIYPNPVNEYVYIEISDDLKIQTFSLFDIYGKLIRTEPVNNQNMKVDLQPLPSGFYFILSLIHI